MSKQRTKPARWRKVQEPWQHATHQLWRGKERLITVAFTKLGISNRSVWYFYGRNAANASINTLALGVMRFWPHEDEAKAAARHWFDTGELPPAE